MPLYEYSCPKCGEFEVIQNFSDKPLKCKPDCEEKKCPKKAERLISLNSFHLKGGGWYADGYGGGSKSAGTAAPKTGSAAKSADSKTEAAPASESKAKPAKSEG